MQIWIHNDVLASKLKRERFAGLIFFDMYIEGELLSWLSLRLGAEC